MYIDIMLDKTDGNTINMKGKTAIDKSTIQTCILKSQSPHKVCQKITDSIN